MAQNNNNNQKVAKQNVESIEKYFFKYILENPKYFSRVEPISFQNTKIRYIYEKIRDYYMRGDKAVVPTNTKIFELIRLYDVDGQLISNEYLKSLLSVDLAKMIQGDDDTYLVKSFQSWVTSTNMRSKFFDAIEMIRDMNEIDYNNTEFVANSIREIMACATLMDFDDGDLGLDFFDAESHFQDTAESKVNTGWASINELLNGGWSKKTLNIIIGGSNSGKSLWLGNVAVNGAENGKNVLYVTLEMSHKEVIKRMGSKWLNIHIDEYDEKSRDKVFMERKIKEIKSRNVMMDDDIFGGGVGNIFIKEFPSGTCSVDDIDNHIKKLEETKNIKIDMVIVDYLTIMGEKKGGDTSLYSNGKYLSNGLRAIAQKRNLVMVTAMQIGKDAQNSPDINIQDMSESKAIFENSDCLFGIIRTPEMRMKNEYLLKLLKLRNGGFKWEYTSFKLDPAYLSIVNDKKIETLI
jgi:replicative DNA helicase